MENQGTLKNTTKYMGLLHIYGVVLLDTHMLVESPNADMPHVDVTPVAEVSTIP